MDLFSESQVELKVLIGADASRAIGRLRSDQIRLVWSELSSMNFVNLLVVAPVGREFSLPVWVGQAYSDWRAEVASNSKMKASFRRDIKAAGCTTKSIWWGLIGYQDEDVTAAPGLIDPRVAQAFTVPIDAREALSRAVLSNERLFDLTLLRASARTDICHPMRDISWGTIEAALVQSPKASVALLLPRGGGLESQTNNPVAQDAVRELNESYSALTNAVVGSDLRTELFGLSGANVSWPFPCLFAQHADMARQVIARRAGFIASSGLPHFFSQLALFAPGNDARYLSGQPVEVLKAIEKCDSRLASLAPSPSMLIGEYLRTMIERFPAFGSNPLSSLPRQREWKPADESFLVH